MAFLSVGRKLHIGSNDFRIFEFKMITFCRSEQTFLIN
uniref:Uncharacterized protein n=1 Tax=Anguilla anguilla TaxID=7936 RepID=A0A0E9TI50_ANGAN